MKTEITTALELGEAELEQWRQWQRQDPRLASPYLCPELAVIQARRNPNLRIAVMRDGNDIVGFLPFEKKSTHVAHVRMVIARPEFTWNAHELMAACDAAVFEFDYLVDHQLDTFRPHHYELHTAPVADLRDGWQAWVDRKNKASSQVKSFQRKQRKLAREVGALDFEMQSASHADLDLLIKWKSAQLILTGRFNRFADPQYVALFHDLLDFDSEHFSIHLSRLDAGDRTVGLHLTATSQQIASVWHTAYDPDPEFDKYSCGMALMLSHMETAADKGFVKIEFGRGEARYKELFKDYDEHVVEGWSERPSAAAYLRRAQLAPKRLALRVVLGNPRLRLAARHTLAKLGELRAKVQKVERTEEQAP